MNFLIISIGSPVNQRKIPALHSKWIFHPWKSLIVWVYIVCWKNFYCTCWFKLNRFKNLTALDTNSMNLFCVHIAKAVYFKTSYCVQSLKCRAFNSSRVFYWATYDICIIQKYIASVSLHVQWVVLWKLFWLYMYYGVSCVC